MAQIRERLKMILDTTFNIDETVIDRVYNREVRIVGIKFKSGRVNPLNKFRYEDCYEFFIETKEGDIWPRCINELKKKPVDKYIDEYLNFARAAYGIEISTAA